MANFDLNLGALTGANGLTVQGININDFSGFSVSDAGDINGDGFDDFIIGAVGANQSYVVFGKGGTFSPRIDLAELNSLEGFLINGINDDDQVGHAVSRAGDINGDGIDDIILGARSADPNNKRSAGQSYVIFGSRRDDFGNSIDLSNLDGENGFILNGIDPGDEAGFAVSGAGDINGDGIDDVIISAPGGDPSSNNAGEIYVVFGNLEFDSTLDLSTLNGTNGFTINGISLDDLSGFSVSHAGDFNDDEIDDLIIGAPSASTDLRVDVGESYIVFGKQSFASSLNLSTLSRSGFFFSGINERDRAGTSVSNVGDINGDGIDDIIIGANGADPDGKQHAGESYVVFGGDRGLETFQNLATLDGTNGFTITGRNAGDGLGFSVSGVGDFNGDGIDDVLVSAPNAVINSDGDRGQSYLIYGSAEGFEARIDVSILDNGLKGFALNGKGTGRVSGAGNVNGDNKADILISASGANSGRGESYLVFGQGRGPTSAQLIGTRANDTLRGLSTNETLLGLAGNDLLIGKGGNDTLRGGEGNDKIIGSGGRDVLVGGGGSDRLLGGNGKDTLRGGLGQDKFIFQDLRHGRDQVSDFRSNEDQILISQQGFELDLSKGRLAKGRFVIGSVALERNDRIIYNDQTGALMYDADGSGLGAAITFAQLNKNTAIVASDFKIV